MPAHVKLTPDDKERIVELYREGYKKYELAAIYGVSTHYITKTVYDYLSSHNDAYSNYERKKLDDIADKVAAMRKSVCIGDRVTVPESYEQNERSGIVTGKYPHIVTAIINGYTESFSYIDFAICTIICEGRTC